MSEDMPQGKQTVSDSEIIQYITNHEDPFVRASEVADHFDHSRQWAHRRLQLLCDSAAVNKKASQRSAIYWVSDEES